MRTAAKLILTFDKSQEDISTLIVAKEGFGFLSPDIQVINIITGEEAEKIWNRLEKNEKGQK